MGLDIWILDALRRTPHPTHAHLERALEWIARAAPKRAVLTNMHIDLDYETVKAETPDHIEPAYDGLRLTVPD
jgi:phosphoribosyl 1,2-cyclic phosphate phosphodiesterase